MKRRDAKHRGFHRGYRRDQEVRFLSYSINNVPQNAEIVGAVLHLTPVVVSGAPEELGPVTVEARKHFGASSELEAEDSKIRQVSGMQERFPLTSWLAKPAQCLSMRTLYDTSAPDCRFSSDRAPEKEPTEIKLGTR